MEKMMERLKASNLGLKDIDDKKGIVRAYVNKFNVEDSYGDVSLPGSFVKTSKERLKKIFWILNHNWDKLLGVTLALEEDGIGLIATGQFNLKKQIAVDTMNDYMLFAEHGTTLQHSVRVQAVKYEKNPSTEYGLIVSEWKMKEWSTLTQPGAVENTPLLSIKSEANQIDMLKKALGLPYSDERLKSIEDKIVSLTDTLKSLQDGAGAPTPQQQPNNERQAKELIDFVKNLKIG
jgi:HK97 family phage prohead protease